MTITSTFKIKPFNVNYLVLISVIFIATVFSLPVTIHAAEQQTLTTINDQISPSAFSARSVEKSATATKPRYIITQKLSGNSPETLGKTRVEHLLNKQKMLNASKLTNFKSQQIDLAQSLYSQSTNYSDFGIYRAFSYLVDDIDEDGFYQSFSIVFDADIYHASYAEVYAELYLRKDGGPWIHYYSSDVFSLLGESEDDEFEVSTTLEQGFTNGFYDVLIDLYEANSDELVVSYGSDDDSALYGLTLESSDYDQLYVTETEIIYSNGGSLSLITLLMIFILALLRNTVFHYKNTFLNNFNDKK